MKKGKLLYKIYITLISFLLALASTTTILIFKKYDILPLKYFIISTGIIIMLTIILEFFMLKKKIKKKIKIIISIFSIIFITALSIVLFYINRTFKFIKNIQDNGYLTENYEIIVLDNKYSNIYELENKKIGFYKNETSQVEEALEKLNRKVQTENIEYKDHNELIDKLLNDEVDAIIIEESYHEIINETNEEFSKRATIIHKIEVEKKSEVAVKHVDVKKETFNIYISGIDTYGKISSVSRSDVNIVATINPVTHQILLTSIPRDYYVQLDGTTGLKDKLTHAGIYGIDKSIKTIENLLEIEINYYIKVNFSSLEKIVDALGGVDVYSEYSFIGYENSTFKKGYNRVNGAQALEFARTRKAFVAGDKTRGQNQEALIHGMINKFCSKEIITKYTSLLNSLNGSFQTNMTTEQITDLIKKQIDEMAAWNITSIGLDGTGASMYTYSYSGQKLYVMIPSENSLANAKQKIENVTNDIILESSYKENNGPVNIPGKIIEENKEEPKPVEEPTEEIKPIEENTELEVQEETTEEIKDENQNTNEDTSSEITEEQEETVDNEEESQELAQDTNETQSTEG